jgi:polysaccharide biosynthesis/export protein
MTLRAALVLMVAMAAGSLGAESRPTATGIPESPADYRIGPEDVLQISVWKNEALSRTVPVRPDGQISLPLLNDVAVAGLTPMQLRDALMRRLATYMPSPEVSVIVSEVKSFKVSVIGDVPKPDRYELRSSATVMDVLAMAGGPTEFASRGHIVVLRTSGQKVQRLPFDYDKVAAGDSRQENFLLRPGDIVVVP